MSTRRRHRALAAIAVVGWLSACATPRPVLRDVSRQGGSAEVARQCTEADRAYRESGRGRREQVTIVGLAVVCTAALGATAGGLYGLELGDTSEAVVTGTAVGSGVGLVGGIGYLFTKLQRDSKLRIGACAREHGYEVVGWE